MNLKYKLLKIYQANETDWHDWRWQMRHRINTVEELEKLVPLTLQEKKGIKECLKVFSMALTPHYASLMHPTNKNCPVRKQAIPTMSELSINNADMVDPLHEDKDSPVPGQVTPVRSAYPAAPPRAS